MFAFFDKLKFKQNKEHRIKIFSVLTHHYKIHLVHFKFESCSAADHNEVLKNHLNTRDETNFWNCPEFQHFVVLHFEKFHNNNSKLFSGYNR